MRRLGEELVGRAEVLADVVGFAQHVRQEPDVLVLLGHEVEDLHVARLPVAIQTAVALLQLGRVPRAVVVQQVAGRALQVEALGGGVGAEQYADRLRRVVERPFDQVALSLVHAAVEREDALCLVTLAQPPGDVVERGLVLGEHHQALVVAPGAVVAPVSGAVVAEQRLDHRDQSVEARVGERVASDHVAGGGVQPQACERGVDGRRLLLHVRPRLLQPRADHAGGDRLAGLRLAVVAGLALHRAARRVHVGLAGRRRLSEPLAAPAP
ncbi:MAG: hypothetical protein BWY94_02263 [Actinobacteria bacterium ADurb.BinA094]|nr:MAG: hypothetical protein BWY94_02263 [Actinobacteria bacterium ADurb.BinA094]